ncbi:MAG: glutathione S-transferase family protein [Pseudobdellovibrionaceae bacterium]
MKLYSMVPQDCSGKVRWLLMELGVSFEEKKLSFKAGDLKAESYLAKHPMGQVPVLEDGNTTIYESYAIVAYLADKYIECGLAPDPKNIEDRGQYYKWLFFSSNTAEGFFSKLQKLPKMNEDYRQEWGDYIQDKVQKTLLIIEKQLTDRDYILGKFSAVDTCLGYALDAIVDEPFFKDFPRTQGYYSRLCQREACQRSEIFKRS